MQQNKKGRRTKRNPTGQPALITNAQPDLKTTECRVVAVGKRRDGGTRYWCLEHRADATAKYGLRADACRAAHIPVITASDVDDTFGEVEIDGIKLDPQMVRVLMAQSAMPSIYERVQSFACPKCCAQHFSLGAAAYAPAAIHHCAKCQHQFGAPGRLRNVIGNPVLLEIGRLALAAPQSPQYHRLDLLPETL